MKEPMEFKTYGKVIESTLLDGSWILVTTTVGEYQISTGDYKTWTDNNGILCSYKCLKANK